MTLTLPLLPFPTPHPRRERKHLPGWQLGGVIKPFSVFYLLHLFHLSPSVSKGEMCPGEALRLTSKGVCVSSSGAQCWTAQSLK